MRSNIIKGKCMTKFSRAFVQMAVEYGVADKSKLLHYDILKDVEAKKSLSQIAIKRGVSKRTVIRILNHYRRNSNPVT